MKKLILLFSITILFSSCNTNPDYKRNLETAKKHFELHGEENLDGQLSLFSKDMEANTSMYGSKPFGYDQFAEMLKGYHAEFDNIEYTADNWLPGTGEDGKPDGSVRTYGTWAGTNVATGKELNLKGYWYMNFDADGKIIATGDFFDFGGMIDAVYPKNLVFIQIDVKNGMKQEVLDLLNSKQGLATTVAQDGCIGYEMAFNEESSTFHLVGNWESYEKYAAYLNWRQTEDDLIDKMIPFLKGGANGLVVSQPNTNYQSF